MESGKLKKLNMYVLFGAPGSGKTDQARLLQEKFGFAYLSWSKIARKILSENNVYPEFKKSLSDSYTTKERAPKGMIADVFANELEKIIDNQKTKGVIIDSYPRYPDEANELISIINKLNINLKAAIVLNVYYPHILERIKFRKHCKLCGNKYDEYNKPPANNLCDIDSSVLENAYDDVNEVNIKQRYDTYIEESCEAINLISKSAEISFAVDANQDEILIFAEIVHKLQRRDKLANSIFEKTGETRLPTSFGDFRLIGYQNRTNYEYHLVLALGDLENKRRVPVRIHSSCITGDIFHSEKCDCGEQLSAAMDYIQKVGHGAILYLFQEGRGINIINKISAYVLQEKGLDTVEANESLNFPNDLRDYTVVKSMLNDLKIKTVDLITNNPSKMGEIQSLGIVVEGRIPLVVKANKNNERYLQTQKEKAGHELDQLEDKTNNAVLEMEVKFPLSDDSAERIRGKIKFFNNVVFEGRFYERTSNFDNKDKLMYNQDARLRVREISKTKEDKNKKIEFCFKKRISVGGIKQEEETQAEFTTDPNNFIELLKRMGYFYSDGYERYRETYKYQDIKITLDEFPFGYLLEIEGEEKDIISIMEILGLKMDDSYHLSCDDFYTLLCEKSDITPKKTILFDDPDMPKYDGKIIF